MKSKVIVVLATFAALAMADPGAIGYGGLGGVGLGGLGGVGLGGLGLGGIGLGGVGLGGLGLAQAGLGGLGLGGLGVGRLGLGAGLGVGGVGLRGYGLAGVGHGGLGGVGLGIPAVGHGGLGWAGVASAASSIRRNEDVWGNNQLQYQVNSPLTGDFKSHGEVRDPLGGGRTNTVELAPNGIVRTRTTINRPILGGTSQIITGTPLGRYIQSKHLVEIPATGGAYGAGIVG